MAKPDMSRNKDLVGRTVSKGGCNISCNENGYAARAIKTGSKADKAVTPSTDTMSGGGSDRGNYGGSVYGQEHFSDNELRNAAGVRAVATTDKTTWVDVHDYMERIRSNYGYPDDSGGSRYIPLEMGGDGQGNEGGGFSYEAAPTYTSRYQDQIDDLTRQVLNREAFSYGPEKDPTYQQYKEGYTRNGERVMQGTPRQVNVRTDDLASSYAGGATQQTCDNYTGVLTDKIPELKQLAYSMYQDEGNTQRADLETLMAPEQGNYAKYAGLLAQHNTDRGSDYGVHRNDISDEHYNSEWSYPVGRDQIADRCHENGTAYSRETYRDEAEYNRALAKAQTLTAGGDFSSYKALGYMGQEIAGLKNAYNKAQASVRSGGGFSKGGSSGGGKSGGSSTSEDAYVGMYKTGIHNEDDAYAWLLSAGYNTTRVGRLAGYYADWMKNQGGSRDSDNDAQIDSRYGDSWTYIPGHGCFTYDEVENYVNSGKVIETCNSATNIYTCKWNGNKR